MPVVNNGLISLTVDLTVYLTISRDGEICSASMVLLVRHELPSTLAALEQPIQRLIAKATAGKTNTDNRLPPTSAAATSGDISPA